MQQLTQQMARIHAQPGQPAPSTPSVVPTPQGTPAPQRPLDASGPGSASPPATHPVVQQLLAEPAALAQVRSLFFNSPEAQAAIQHEARLQAEQHVQRQALIQAQQHAQQYPQPTQ